MPFLDSLDVANRACQILGVNQILSVTEDSPNNLEISNAYDKVRRAELRRNVWRFAVRKAVLRAMDTTTLQLVPGVYDATKTYLLGEIVQDTNNLFWLSQNSANIGNTPGGNNDAWDMYFGPMVASLWTASTNYLAGELVYMLSGSSYQLFLSLTNTNGDTPNVATAWSATNQYKQDDVVSFSAQQWRSLLPVNVNLQPDISPTAWTNTPTLTASSINWRPITASLKNPIMVYPIGAGPSTQESTRNIYRLPAGYMRTAPQFGKSGDSGILGAPTQQPFNDWQYNGNYIVSEDLGPLILRFVADVTKVSEMDDMFCEGFACRIATATCVRLTQSDAKLKDIASEYNTFMGQARLVNGIEEGPIYSDMDEYIAVRR